MIGSETFIIVAFRCSENSTPCCLASAICACTKLASARLLITAASMISPACTAVFSFSTVTLPSLPTSSILTLPACAISAERSLP